MFRTHKPFKFPIQFGGDESTVWRAVEVVFNMPWLLATIEVEEEAVQTFLLNGTDDLLQCVEAESGLGRLVAVRLVLPPAYSPSSDWTFVPVCRIERELRSFDGAIPSAVLTSGDGRRYGGLPIGLTERDDGDLALLVELPIATS